VSVPFLAGPRVHLQPFTEDDLPTFLTWMNDFRTRRYILTTFPRTLETEKRRLAESADMNTKTDNLRFGVWITAENRLIGHANLHDIDWVNRNCRIGLTIGDKSSWGKDVAGEVASILFDYAFGELGLHKVIAGIGSPNFRSNGAARKLGYTLAGTRRGEFFVNGEFIDGNTYELFDRDWHTFRQERKGQDLS